MTICKSLGLGRVEAKCESRLPLAFPAQNVDDVFDRGVLFEIVSKLSLENELVAVSPSDPLFLKEAFLF